MFIRKALKKKTVLLPLLYFIVIHSPSVFPIPKGLAFFEKNITFFLYLFMFLFVCFVFRPEIKTDFFGFIKSKNGMLLFVVLIATLFSDIAIAIIIDKLNIINYNQNLIDNAETNLVLLYLAVVVFGPVVEEFVFRYCVFSLFSSKKWLAIVISVITFSFMHVWDYVLIDRDFSQLVAMLPHVTFGISCCYLYMKTKNIFYPVLLHVIINFLAIL